MSMCVIFIELRYMSMCFRSEEEPTESCSKDMVDIDLEKIKGDAIGDTVYSERYVLKVLIQLSQVTTKPFLTKAETVLRTSCIIINYSHT